MIKKEKIRRGQSIMTQPVFSAMDSPSPTVLVVDDNEDMVYIVTRLLSSHGLNVLGATNGPECLVIVRSRPVDVVILDVMMPGMDGLEVCRRLKQISPSLPVIFLTIMDDMATRAAGLALGVSEFVSKPFNRWDLLARVHIQILTHRWEKGMRQTHPTIGPVPKIPSTKN
jgi:CheY-like chemotaxis protein